MDPVHVHASYRMRGHRARLTQLRAGLNQGGEQAEASYTRTVCDWQAARPAKAKAAGPAKVGASVTPGHA